MLDEATSALDEDSQAKVQAALDNIMQNRTSIVIAHRLTTVERCSRIVVIQDGVVIEEGDYKDLMQQEGSHMHNLAKGMAKNKQ
jgi:ABC-type multidrug transport system fused ATPase/permease subunit